jgi:predicted transcriptional regulator
VVGKPKKKTSLNLSADLHSKIRILAIKNGESMAALIERAIRALLAKS